MYSGPSLKGHSNREDTPLERTQIFGSKYYECNTPSHQRTPLRTELFGRRGVLIIGGPLYTQNQLLVELVVLD